MGIWEWEFQVHTHLEKVPTDTQELPPVTASTGLPGSGEKRKNVLVILSSSFVSSSCRVLFSTTALHNSFFIQQTWPGGAWVAQLVWTSDSWFLLRSWSQEPEFEPRVRLHAQPRVCFSLWLCLSPALSLKKGGRAGFITASSSLEDTWHTGRCSINTGVTFSLGSTVYRMYCTKSFTSVSATCQNPRFYIENKLRVTRGEVGGGWVK